MGDTLLLNPDGSVTGLTDGRVLSGRECDNTHEQNRTVCRWCWAHGRRNSDDAEVYP